MTSLSSAPSRRPLRSHPSPLPHIFNRNRRFYSHSTRLTSSFYDDFEDFGELGSDSSGGGRSSSKKGDGAESIKPKKSSNNGDKDISGGGNDDALMKSLRDRMNDLSKDNDAELDDDEDDDDEGLEEEEDLLDGTDASSFSSIDDLIEFAQSKAREKGNNDASKSGETPSAEKTWEEENWARPIPHLDETTGEALDFDDILKDGIVLVANPAKFYPDIAEQSSDRKNKGGGSILSGLFDDPFPLSPQSSIVSPALLAKFGITSPPTPDQGPDYRAGKLPVLLLLDRDPLMGCKALMVNQRSGSLIGDVATNPNYNTNSSKWGPFFIQPLWIGGTQAVITSWDSTSYDITEFETFEKSLQNPGMLHMCPFVTDSQNLTMCDGLYWGGDPGQAQEAMIDERLDKPMSGFDFKFFVKDTRWLPSQLEEEIMDGTWHVTTVSKEVLFRNRDRLGPKRAKPLWTEIMELLGDDYKHIVELLYGEEEDDDLM